MTYQPFLAEAAGGSVEPQHVIAPLPRVLPAHPGADREDRQH
jgi:NADH:quinone reductase (non-electrogenic)